MAQTNREFRLVERIREYASLLAPAALAVVGVAAVVYLSAADPGLTRVETTTLAASPETMSAASNLVALAGGGVLSVISFAWALQRR